MAIIIPAFKMTFQHVKVVNSVNMHVSALNRYILLPSFIMHGVCSSFNLFIVVDIYTYNSRCNCYPKVPIKNLSMDMPYDHIIFTWRYFTTKNGHLNTSMVPQSMDSVLNVLLISPQFRGS